MTIVAKRSLPLLMILALLLGVGVATAQDEAVDTSAWALHQGESTYLLTPADWIDLNDPELFTQGLEQMAEDYPELAQGLAVAQAQLGEDLYDLFLGDGSSGASLNVVAVDLGQEIPVSFLETTLIAQYDQIGSEVLDLSTVELTAGTAIRAQLIPPMAEGMDDTPIQIQYVLTQETFMYVMGFTAVESDLDEQQPIFDAVASSFGIGEAPAELGTASEGGSGDRPAGDVVEPPARDDVVRHSTPWINIVVSPDWFGARDGDAFNEFIAANGAHPLAASVFETFASDVAEGTYQYILVQPQDLAFMTLIVTDLGADIPVSTFQVSQEDAIKDNPDMEFIDGDIVSTPAGDVLRIEVRRPIMGGEEFHELRVFWVANQNFVYMNLAVPEAVYAEYEQIFADIINTVSFPE